LYENFITDLVSHGYIVVAINTSFINRVELPDGHIVKEAEIKNPKEEANKFIPLQAADLSYVFKKIHTLHNSNAIFSAMDLKHIGAFGHSIGARVVANTAHAHPTWFQAAATFDIGTDPTGASIKKFVIPFMNELSSMRINCPWPAHAKSVQLGHQGYLVVIDPNKHDFNYSSHMIVQPFNGH
jgi:dienelactone hydrolase